MPDANDSETATKAESSAEVLNPGGRTAADDILQRFRVVLVRPQGAANVGAVARAMKNMGFKDLALVGTSKRRQASAKTTAVHAADLLATASRFATIEQAVGDCTLVVGTTAQGGAYRDAPEGADDIADSLLAVARRGRVALLFGPESHGLTRSDLRACQRLVRIDTAAEYDSLNLAQAALLLFYELRRHALAAQAMGQAEEGRAAARAIEIFRLEEQMRAVLVEIGFLNPQNPDRIMFVLRRMLGRAVLRPLEVRVLLALVRQVKWCTSVVEKARRAGLIAQKRERS